MPHRLAPPAGGPTATPLERHPKRRKFGQLPAGVGKPIDVATPVKVEANPKVKQEVQKETIEQRGFWVYVKRPEEGRAPALRRSNASEHLLQVQGPIGEDTGTFIE